MAPKQGTSQVVKLHNRDTLDDLILSWDRELQGRIDNGRANSLSEETVKSYVATARALHDFLTVRHGPLDVTRITSEHINAFLDHYRTPSPEIEKLLNDRREDRRREQAKALGVVFRRHAYRAKPERSSGGWAKHYRNLGVFFAWVVEEEGLDENPFVDIEPPAKRNDDGDEGFTRVFTDAEIDRLLAHAKKLNKRGDFRSRRDAAILSVFLYTPARLGGVASMTVAGTDLAALTVRVVEKGNKQRVMNLLHPDVVSALDRYMRERKHHQHAYLEALWLGPKGKFTASGISQALGAIFEECGIPDGHPHMARHSWVHWAKSNEYSDEFIRAQGGWTDNNMIDRIYGRAARGDRIAAEAKRIRERRVQR